MSHPDIDSLNDFTVERADDLTEMVLALRGAGYRFVESTKTLEKIYENLVENVEKFMIIHIFPAIRNSMPIPHL